MTPPVAPLQHRHHGVVTPLWRCSAAALHQMLGYHRCPHYQGYQSPKPSGPVRPALPALQRRYSVLMRNSADPDRPNRCMDASRSTRCAVCAVCAVLAVRCMLCSPSLPAARCHPLAAAPRYSMRAGRAAASEAPQDRACLDCWVAAVAPQVAQGAAGPGARQLAALPDEERSGTHCRYRCCFRRWPCNVQHGVLPSRQCVSLPPIHR